VATRSWKSYRLKGRIKGRVWTKKGETKNRMVCGGGGGAVDFGAVQEWGV